MNARISFLNRLALGVAVSLSATGAFAQTKTWSGAGANLKWSTGANWGGSAPSVNGSIVNFGSGAPTNKRAINVDVNTVELGTVNVTANDYVFGGLGQLKISDGGTINNTGTNTKFNSLYLVGNGGATLSGNGTATSVVSIQGDAGSSLRVNGGQTLNVADTATVTTNLIVGGGATPTGTLKVAGTGDFAKITVQNGGTLSGPGGGNYFSGTVTDYQQVAGGNTNVNIAGLAHDQYDGFSSANAGSGTAILGGTLNLNFDNSNTYVKGDSWKLFDSFGSYTGNFASVASTGGIGAGLTWGTDANGNWSSSVIGAGPEYLVFNKTNGNLVVVPEPSTIVFAGVGIAMAGWSAWKKRRIAKA